MKRSLFRTSIYVLGFIVLVVVVSSAFFASREQWGEKAVLQDRIDQLEREALSVQNKNQQLKNTLEYVASTGAVERLARQELGMKKEGEIAIIFTQDQNQGVNSELAQTEKSHIWSWWEYFFKKE